MGTKLVLGFGSTANQAVVHLAISEFLEREGFGSTVIQVVVHQNQAKLQLARGF